MSNAKIQRSFRSATQSVTSVLKSNEIFSGNDTSQEENIAKIKDSLVRPIIIHLIYSYFPSHRLNGSTFAKRQFKRTPHLTGRKIRSLAGNLPSQACLGSLLNFSNNSRPVFPGSWLMPMSPSRHPGSQASPRTWVKQKSRALARHPLAREVKLGIAVQREQGMKIGNLRCR
jgi:hypothetical protein